MAKSAIPRSATVAQALLQRITSEELPAGSMLPTERELQETYNVSRPVVREAIKGLAARGLVSIKAGQGVVVGGDLTTPAAEALLLAFHRAQVRTEDMLSTRLLLEPNIAPLAAVNASPLEIRRLQRYAETMEATTFVDGITPAKATLWAITDSRFHVLLAQASQNPVLAVLIEVIVGILWRQRQTVNQHVTEELRAGASRQHTAIAEAVAARDAERARQAMLEHLQSTSANFGSLTVGLSALVDTLA